uniref:OSJNBa0043L24.1 protein n=1 Tax=Oryza sativa subsp. japonica TaxID=39947 RepID=Q7X8G0_ORYSJ|nr:OSJNBa0043L24.1 [Oryza sativa Japonica Group]CAE05683.1 OSJNBb0002J11.9 [Oryza sativa Japonica Group]
MSGFQGFTNPFPKFSTNNGAGGRRKKGRPRWTADGGRVHRSKRNGFGLRGAHRSDEGVEKERANGSDSPEGVRRRWNSIAASGGERKGKSPRSDEDSIKGGESISGVQGAHFRGRMGLSGAVEVRRREAASGGGRQWRRGHAGWRRSLGWRLRAFGRATELPRKLEGTRVSGEGEREGGTTEPGAVMGGGGAGRALRPRAGEGEGEGARIPASRVHARTGLPGASATNSEGDCRAGWQQWRGGGWAWKRGGKGGARVGFYGCGKSVLGEETDLGRSRGGAGGRARGPGGGRR